MKEFHLAAARLALAVICVAVSRAEVALSQATTRSLSRDSATIRLIEHPAVPRQPFGLRLAESPSSRSADSTTTSDASLPPDISF